MNKENISVIGLGAMGSSLNTLLLRSGHNVTGYDIVEARIFNLLSLGINPVKSPKEAAEAADLIVLSLPSWEIVKQVVEGEKASWQARIKIR